jgi:hypothetical protein
MREMRARDFVAEFGGMKVEWNWVVGLFFSDLSSAGRDFITGYRDV